MEIEREKIKDKLKRMKPSEKMTELQYTFFQGYCSALEWILDE